MQDDFAAAVEVVVLVEQPAAAVVALAVQAPDDSEVFVVASQADAVAEQAVALVEQPADDSSVVADEPLEVYPPVQQDYCSAVALPDYSFVQVLVYPDQLFSEEDFPYSRSWFSLQHVQAPHDSLLQIVLGHYAPLSCANADLLSMHDAVP